MEWIFRFQARPASNRIAANMSVSRLAASYKIEERGTVLLAAPAQDTVRNAADADPGSGFRRKEKTRNRSTTVERTIGCIAARYDSAGVASCACALFFERQTGWRCFELSRFCC